ncbi:MAG: DUF1015 domain-containing protein [Clostridia bacterium]|nr:DUF1015 domain-containing protein [Clostridia bacterium]
MKSNSIGFTSAEILLPDFTRTNGTQWATVACDQYTSEPHYWNAVEQTVQDAPSTLRMILPEVWLEEADARVPQIHATMNAYLQNVLISHPNAMIYLERTQSDGSIRPGIIGAIDLEQYDYHRGSSTLIRATEGTVLERIPPRIKIRRGAPLELPHVMLLIDDPQKGVIAPLAKRTGEWQPLYDFDLMQSGGHLRAYLLDASEQERITKELTALISPAAMERRYGDATLAPLLFAVGDGNHSLASAKAAYEEVKASIGEDAAKQHPARYALAEVVNLHEPALQFEPIYRVVMGCDQTALLTELTAYLAGLNGSAHTQSIRWIIASEEGTLTVPHPVQQLAVGTLQAFLSDYTAQHPEVTVDYIHGEDSLRALAQQPNAVGFLFDGMKKEELFRTVIYDGALPRKTFSMGHADDKRYYVECRRLRT